MCPLHGLSDGACRVGLTCVVAALAVLGVAKRRAVDVCRHGSRRGRRTCRLLRLPLLCGLRALFVLVAVALAKVVEAKVLDLVAAAAAGARVGPLLALLALVLEAEELQLGLLFGFALGGPEPAGSDRSIVYHNQTAVKSVNPMRWKCITHKVSLKV